MPIPYTPPAHGADAFNCPLCHAYARQIWQAMFRNDPVGGVRRLPEFSASRCSRCDEWLYWHDEKIIVPDVTSAPPPNEDLSDEIRADYAESATIAAQSPRGAAALLRLCIQKLCVQLGEKGRDLNHDIGQLVKKGLDVRVQKALDTVRVIGNEAVHPGELDLRDDPEIAGTLFTLVNAIANDMLTQPRLRDELYGKLPQTKLDGIAARDCKGAEPAASSRPVAADRQPAS